MEVLPEIQDVINARTACYLLDKMKDAARGGGCHTYAYVDKCLPGTL